jgi:hypothetical protein
MTITYVPRLFGGMIIVGTAVHTPTTYYASPGGSDSNDGLTSGTAWQTLQHACDTVQAGDTVRFADGNYTGNVTSTMTGTGSSPITFASINHLGARIVEDGTSGPGSFLLTLTGSHIRFTDFELTGPDVEDAAVLKGPDIVFSKCWIHDVCNSFVPGSGLASGVTITNDTFVMIGDGCGVQQCRIERIGPKDTNGNIIFNQNTAGIYATCSNAGADGLIENNLILNNSGSGIVLNHNPVHWTVANNTLVNCQYDGIECYGDTASGFFADHDTVENNIIMQCGTTRAIYSPSDYCGTHNVFATNLAFGNYATTYVYQPATVNPVQTDTNLPNANPLFVNFQTDGGGDYHLSTGSPAIDAGTLLGAPLIDFDGIVRPLGSGIDIGAYEYLTLHYALFPATARRAGLFPTPVRRTGVMPAPRRRQSG